MLTAELFAPERPEPPEVVAFRMLQEVDWEKFMLDVTDETAATKFFNPELKEFSHADSWEELSTQYNFAPFSDDLAVPPGVLPSVRDFCRDLRNGLRASDDEWVGGCKAFYDPLEWVDWHSLSYAIKLVVVHDGGSLAPRFNLDYEQTLLYNGVDELLLRRGLWRDHRSGVESHIYEL